MSNSTTSEGYTLLDQASQSESLTGDDIALLRRDSDGAWFERMNGNMTEIKPASLLAGRYYSLRRENDYELADGAMRPMSDSFTIITPANLSQYANDLPTILREEIELAFLDGTDSAVEWHHPQILNKETEHFAYFPDSRRGCAGYLSSLEWTDCTSLDDLMDRWENYDERWSN